MDWFARCGRSVVPDFLPPPGGGQSIPGNQPLGSSSKLVKSRKPAIACAYLLIRPCRQCGKLLRRTGREFLPASVIVNLGQDNRRNGVLVTNWKFSRFCDRLVEQLRHLRCPRASV